MFVLKPLLCLLRHGSKQISIFSSRLFEKQAEAEFTEFEPGLKFQPRLKYDWLHLKSYSLLQDLSHRSIETVFGGSNSLN